MLFMKVQDREIFTSCLRHKNSAMARDCPFTALIRFSIWTPYLNSPDYSNPPLFNLRLGEMGEKYVCWIDSRQGPLRGEELGRDKYKTDLPLAWKHKSTWQILLIYAVLASTFMASSGVPPFSQGPFVSPFFELTLNKGTTDNFYHSWVKFAHHLLL